jgi:hypothetical protein
MMRTSERIRAAGAAGLLLVAGMALGIAVDRLVLTPAPADASALTVESLARRIDLSPEDAAGLRALLDSVHADVLAAAARGPQAAQAATRAAHGRIEASLDPRARQEFRAWMRGHREHMMRSMHRGMMDGR